MMYSRIRKYVFGAKISKGNGETTNSVRRTTEKNEAYFSTFIMGQGPRGSSETGVASELSWRPHEYLFPPLKSTIMLGQA